MGAYYPARRARAQQPRTESAGWMGGGGTVQQQAHGKGAGHGSGQSGKVCTEKATTDGPVAGHSTLHTWPSSLRVSSCMPGLADSRSALARTPSHSTAAQQLRPARSGTSGTGGGAGTGLPAGLRALSKVCMHACMAGRQAGWQASSRLAGRVVLGWGGGLQAGEQVSIPAGMQAHYLASRQAGQ